MNNQTYHEITADPNLAPLLGQLIIRDDLLATLLGDDTHEIAYWAGKRLARNYPVTTFADLTTLFQQFNFGNLTLVSQTNTKIMWQLDGPLVAARFKLISDADFDLETGFISQICEYILGVQTESECDYSDKAKQTIKIETFISKERPVDTISSDNDFQINN